MPLSPDRVIRRVISTTVCEDYPPREHGPLSGRDLSFAGESTQHATHALHTYVAAINPPLTRSLIETYVPRGELICDPFVGGGAVLLEALLAGRQGVGFDVNPLAVMVSKGKTIKCSAKTLSRRIDALVAAVPVSLDTAGPLWAGASPGADLSSVPDTIRFWYRDENLRDLLALRNAYSASSWGDEKWALRTALSATARDAMLTYRGEVRLRRLTGPDLDRFKADTLLLFKKRAAQALQLVPELPDGPRPTIEDGDVLELPLKDGACHSIICSPPYADDKNGVGYFQFSRNMLYWVGHSLDDISVAKGRFMGADVGERPIPPSRTLELCLESIQTKSQRHYLEGLAFYADYYKALEQMLRVVRKRVIIVIGDRVLARTFIDNGRITVELAQSLGATFEHYYSRNFRKKRIPNLGGDGGGGNVEHIIVLRK